MKKVITSIIICFLFNFLFIESVFANSSADANLTTNIKELKAGEKIEIFLSFKNLNEIKKGLNAYKGTIEYDKNFFEEIVESNFSSLNDWEKLKYNPQTGEFISFKKVGITQEEIVAKIILTVKNNVEANHTSIKVKDIITSEGKKDIIINETVLNLNIIKDQVTIPVGPIKPELPSTPNSTGNENKKPSDITNSTDIKVPTSENNNDSNQNENNDKLETDNEKDSNEVQEEKDPKEESPQKEEKITRTKKIYIWLLFIVFIEILILIFYILKKYKKDNLDKTKNLVFFITIGLISTQFIGTVFATAINFALLGELNGDNEVNYADTELLEQHLIHLKNIPENYLANADMNFDKQITITDLTLLIHKLEDKLDYHVEIVDLDGESFHLNKNEQIEVKFNGDVSYGASIKKLIINKKEIEVTQSINNPNEYSFFMNSGEIAELKKYNISAAVLNNLKKIKIDYQFTIDVLKDKPAMINYKVEENKDDSKLILEFDVIDNNNSIENSYIDIFNAEQKLELEQQLNKGKNRIEVPVQEQKDYQAFIVLNYNLSNDKDNTEYKSAERYEKQLQLLIDYNFTISNIKTYKEDKETNQFNMEDKVKLIFESSNTTKHIPESITIEDKEYEITQEDDHYYALLDPVTTLGINTIKLKEVTLSNGKKFMVNNSISFNVIKRNPEIIDFSTTEFTENNQLKVMFQLEDPDHAVQDLTIIVMDDTNTEIDRIKMNRDEVKEDGTVNKFFNTHMTTQYKIKILKSYNLTEKDEDKIVDELSLEETVKADPRVTINQITPNVSYVEKGGIVKLTLDLDTNKNEDITRVLVNNINCIAVKLDNGNYEVTFNANSVSGIYPITITRLTFQDETIATIDETINIEILKNKPTIENFKQIDHSENNEVVLSFDLKDEENSFISGKTILILNDNKIEKEIQKGHNEITYQVEPSKKYTLEIKATYDLDSNALPDQPEENNRIFEETITTKEIELIVDYALNISNIKTYNENGETRYFNKSEPIKLSFESNNVTNFEPVKAVINGTEYDLNKIDNAYYLTINSHRTSGVKRAVIEKITLSNSKEIVLSENNEIKVTILKDKPTIEQFGYIENMDATISASFQVMDEEETITNGKIYVLKNGTIIKEQPLEKEKNIINFQPEENQNYMIKVVADYDLDMNVLEEDANEFKNITLFEADITLGARKFEMKDIIRTSVYKQTPEGITEVKELSESDLSNLNNFIAKVYMKQMPTFYTNVVGYRIENNQLKLILDYDNVVQYTDDAKQDKLEIVFGEMVNGTAENITLEGLIREMEANPTGTFTLTRDYDASIITKNSNSLISSTFMGTLNGNGHKIYNLSKPLFDTIDSATIENLVLDNPKLSGVTSRGTIANIATNSLVRNVHVKNLSLISGTNRVGGIIGEATASTIEQSSVTNLKITTSLHIRVGGIIGNMIGGSIKNCYVEGKIESTQNKDGNGISGILGTGEGTELITIENCITKVHYSSNVSPRLNGDIVGLALNNNTKLVNNVSLSTGKNFYHIHGSTIHSSSTNNYELTESELASNASGNRVKQITKEELTTEFFKNEVDFDENIWDFTDISYENPPKLKSSKEDNTQNDEKPTNNNLYIPDYNRINKINGYTKEKEILYHNLNKLMPYYDAKYLIEDGLKIQNNHELNTKVIKHILPYSNGKLMTYLTSQNQNTITSIKVVFEDFSVNEYNVSFKEMKQNISIYTLNDFNLEYAFNNYVIKETASIVQTLKEYISSMNYTETLDPLTTAADSRLYRDHYDEKIKPLAEIIALQLLQNDSNSVLTIDNDILNNKIKQELIDSGRLNKILYAYNYYHRWYQFEIGGSKVSDILLFEGKMYKDNMTLDNLMEEVLTGNLGTNVTNTFYANSLKKYTDRANLGLFLDHIISSIGGYEDINDWFTEYFSSIGILAEVPVENHPEVKYRAWDRLKGYQNFILPLSTLPKYAGYIISGPAQLQVGAQRTYIKDPDTTAGQNTVKNIVNNHIKLIKRQFDTMAGTFHVESWNNFTIMIYDTVKTITGYKTSYFPGTNIPIGTSAVTTINRVGTTEPFHKNFNEAVGAWQYGSAAGVGNTAGFLWFIATPGLTNYDTWTHEYQHALADKMIMFKSGVRLPLEAYTEGNVEQRDDWSENNINGYDVGPYYFNLAFSLNKEGFATQNLTPERINTREKLENYFKGQLDALELLDYVSAKAFIQLTPEQQAKIATRMAQSGSWSSWGTITAEQATAMNLTTLESLWDNHIILRPNNAWGISVRGLTPINGIGGNDYGYESMWVTRWYMGHNDGGYSDAFTSKKNLFEMLGYGGIDGYVTYGSRRSSNDLDAIQKITQAKTGTAMNWKEYRMSRYAEIERNINNKYVNIEWMIEQFKEALTSDANNANRNITSATNVRKLYYHYLKSATNDFIDDPLGTSLEQIHIKTAEELVQKINKQPYGYYILDNDIDFSNMTTNVTQTFMGKLDGNGHKIIGNKKSIFQKIRYGYVKDLILENTNIPKTEANVGALSVRTEYSVLENIQVKNLQLNFGGRNNLSLVGGTVSTVLNKNIEVETLKYKINSLEDIDKLIEDPGGNFEIENDIDFTTYIGSGSVVTVPFTGKINGKGHTLTNLRNLSLFSNFNGTVENLNIKNFTNISKGDDIAAFAKYSNNATLRNMKFENITLEGQHRVAPVVTFDNANSTFENISVKNANVKGTGVYISTFIGRKYGGSIKNVFVEGNLEIKMTENGGIVGAFQKGGILENVIAKVNIHKTENTYTNIANSERNGGIVGNIYDTPRIRNSISFGNMKGFVDSEGTEKIPYKVTGAAAAMIISTMENCYEYIGSQGFSSITTETANQLKEATEEQIYTQSFYQDTLNFDKELWNFNVISEKGYPELK